MTVNKVSNIDGRRYYITDNGSLILQERGCDKHGEATSTVYWLGKSTRIVVRTLAQMECGRNA